MTVRVKHKPNEARQLPDWFLAVAEDVLEYCRPPDGLWVDLGSGRGGLGRALAEKSQSTVLLIDPVAERLAEGLEEATNSGVARRLMALAARAEILPLPDASVEMVASRGSVFFWDDPPRGLREVYRVLRPSARAMIGGGFGSSYPQWALREFFRRRNEQVKAQGPEAVRKWTEPRRPEWMAAQARAAGIDSCLIKPNPPGLWLLFEKRE